MTSVLCLSSKYLLIDLVIHIDTCTSIVNILKIHCHNGTSKKTTLALHVPQPFLSHVAGVMASVLSSSVGSSWIRAQVGSNQRL